ncbi:MAG: CRISPR-associated helicase/endonuclease Cas3 [Marinilabiliales bacterium]
MTKILLSHPDKKLIDHLSETAKIALKTVKHKTYNFSFDFENEKVNLTELLSDLVWFAAAFHDIGKATSFFQNYIRNPEEIHDKRKSHALFSALFVFFVIEEFLKSKQINNNLKLLIAVLIFTAVKRHHGTLNNLANELFIEEYSELLVEQLNSIDEKEIVPIIDELLYGYDFKIYWGNFKDFIEKCSYKDKFYDFAFDFLDYELNNLPQNTRFTLFYFYQLIYSTLLFSDKNDVILSATNEIKHCDVISKIEQYREIVGFNNPKSQLNKLKNEAYYTSSKNLDNILNKEQHIFSITLPTGLGKTITSFMLADKIRKNFGDKNAKIIIAIPFTSIIDQNFNVYEKILQNPDSSEILKHHHLAEPQYKKDENTVKYDESQFLIETWQSDVIVTTFVQLLEALFSCDKAKIMKLSQLAGSVILLDEIQTVPYALWETIREGFKVLASCYNLYFVFISATQPLIFTPGEEIFEIVPDYKKYFRFFNRTRLHFHKHTVTFDDFKSNIITYLIENPEKDTLIIVNIKRTAKELFEYVCNEIETNNNELYFLTTLITPYERKNIIDRIKNKSVKRKVIVSTQLVEAGVDISVDTVFRQLAPLDSIIQSAGRANRYSEKTDIADVFVYNIKELVGGSSKIYGNDLMLKTENVIKNFEQITEENYLELIEKYFIEVRKQADNVSSDLMKGMINFEFTNVDLKLIEERKTESVFIQINKHAKNIWEDYVEICLQENLKSWERKEKFNKIKSEFYDFVINVPIPSNSETIPFDSEKEYGYYVSKLDNPSKHYKYSSKDLTKNIGYVYEAEISKFL